MKDVRHLTQRTYERLVQGALPAEEARALARHLELPCDACDEFLASRPGADPIDGLADAALGGLAPARGEGNDLELARIEGALGERRRPAPPAPRRLVPGLAAAALLAFGLASLFAPRGGWERASWDGVKGSAVRAAPAPRLRFVVVTPSPGRPPALAKGVSGQVVGRDASLQFEIEASRPAHVALVRVAARGAPEPFWSELVDRGDAPVTIRGRPAAYPLAGLEGAQRFVLVAAEDGLDPDRVARAAAALAPPGRLGADLPALEGLSLDAVEVEVR